MIFDIILILTLIYTIKKSGSKGCTEDLNFSLASLVLFRFAGAIYEPLSMFIGKFVSNKTISVYGSYLVLFIIAFFVYNSFVSKRIIELGKRIPRSTGIIMTYIFAMFKTIIIYSVIFTLLYTLPVLHRLPEKFITPKSYRLTYGILGAGTESLFEKLTKQLSTMANPVDFLEKQKQKQVSGSQKGLDAVKQTEGLENLLPDKEEEKK